MTAIAAIETPGSSGKKSVETHFPSICDQLANRGWSITENFLALDLIASIHDSVSALDRNNQLVPAAVGRRARREVVQSIRGDRIIWLDSIALTAAQHAYLSAMEGLRTTLNRELYLGLVELENHYTCYPPGAFYRRHLDQHTGEDARVVSVLLYLNSNWLTSDGGALRLYLDKEQPPVDIAPCAATLVTFLSDRFEHEVLPTFRERYSVTGWYRRRIIGDNALLINV